MRIYQNNREDLLFSFLEHGNNENPSVISSNDETRVIKRGIRDMISDDFIGEEELELVLIVIISEDNWVEINQTVRNLLWVQVDWTQK